MATIQCVRLPGLKFATWLARITGVVCIASPRNLAAWKSWKNMHFIYVLIVNSCIWMLTIDFFFNIVEKQPDVVQRRRHPVTRSLARGFTIMYFIGLHSSRTYLLWNSMPIESFLSDIQDLSGHTLRRGQNHKRQGSMLLLIGLTIVTIGTVGFSLALIPLDKRQSWFYWMGDYQYAMMALLLGIWPVMSTYITIFALLTTTLDQLLVILEGFCDYAESLLSFHTYRECGDHAGDQRISKIKAQSVNLLTRRNQNVQCRRQSLVQQFRTIKYLFGTYNELYGPLIFIMIIISTAGTIDTVTDMLHSNDCDVKVDRGWAIGLNLAQHFVYLSILESGHRAKNLISNRMIMLQEVLLHTPGDDDELRRIIRKICKWEWKMSAAGFFTVDRSVMGGILSTMLTYTVIVIQLQGKNS